MSCSFGNIVFIRKKISDPYQVTASHTLVGLALDGISSWYNDDESPSEWISKLFTVKSVASYHLPECVKMRSSKNDERIVSDQKLLSEVVESEFQTFLLWKSLSFPSLAFYVKTA